MSALSNVIAARQDFVIQRGANYGWYFRCIDSTGAYIDWTLVPNVKIDVKNAAGQVVQTFTVGNGLSVFEDDHNYLLFRKWANEKDIPPGSYTWDLKVSITEEIVQYPVRGNYTVVNYVTA